MRKKRGGSNNNNNFIENLIKDRAEFLSFYFIINGVEKYKFILRTNFYNKIDLIYNSYIEIINKLNGEKTFKNFVNLIAYYNRQNNINVLNYGTEAHILDFISDIKDDNYINNLNIYLEIIKSNKDTSIGNLDNYFKKIGYDIAIYSYIYEYDYDVNIKDINEYISNNFINYFIKGFNLDIDDFINKCNKEIERYKENNIKLNFDENDNIKLQQYYNIYKYPYKSINNNNIIFINTRKLNFNIPINILNNPNIKQLLLTSIKTI